MLQVEPIGQHGYMATRSGQNLLLLNPDIKKHVASISKIK